MKKKKRVYRCIVLYTRLYTLYIMTIHLCTLDVVDKKVGRGGGR